MHPSAALLVAIAITLCIPSHASRDLSPFSLEGYNPRPLFAFADSHVFNKINREVWDTANAAQVIECLGRVRTPECGAAIAFMRTAVGEEEPTHRYVFVAEGVSLPDLSLRAHAYGHASGQSAQGALAHLQKSMEEATSAVSAPFVQGATMAEIERAAAANAEASNLPLRQGDNVSDHPGVYILPFDPAAMDSALSSDLPKSYVAVVVASLDSSSSSGSGGGKTHEQAAGTPHRIGRHLESVSGSASRQGQGVIVAAYVWRDHFTPGMVEGIIAVVIFSFITIIGLWCLLNIQIPSKFEYAAKYTDASKKMQ